MYEGPEFRHLTTFVTIAEECNFGKAAERLHTTQPALSSHMKHLEEGLQEQLFKRVPHGAELTEAGRNFLPYARHILHLRTHAMKAASRRHSEDELPLRLGYSPFMNHNLMSEALKAYKEIVPEGHINSSSDFTAHLIEMLRDGRLDAAFVTLPLRESEFSEHFVCEEKVLICLRRDDPAAAFAAIPKEVVAKNLKIMFNRAYHPELHDHILKTLKKAGILVQPTETFSAPPDMQFLAKTRACYGLIRAGIPVDDELTTRPIEGVDFRITTALLCHKEQKKPVLPMLAYRMSQLCRDLANPSAPDKLTDGITVRNKRSKTTKRRERELHNRALSGDRKLRLDVRQNGL
jgi:DNA-binding transcriptional LysR family regulator